MGLLSIFKRKSEPAAVNEPADAVQKARSRARQRLIGAAVLLGIGVVGFPLVFETRPRPIPVDIPIEIPRKDGAPALAMPSARGSADPAAPAAAEVHRPEPVVVAAPAPAVVPRNKVITETREDAGLAVPPPIRPAPAARTAEASRPSVPEPAPESAPKPVPKSVAENKPSAGDHGDGARARALLEAKSPGKPEAARFVLQVGAFADAAVARETRLKVEKLGMKTYTQVANTTDGSRIRVRVGPFGTRDEADKALAKARSAGLSAVVLTL